MYKILIVEDDRVIADKMKEHLEKWDYEGGMCAGFQTRTGGVYSV